MKLPRETTNSVIRGSDFKEFGDLTFLRFSKFVLIMNFSKVSKGEMYTTLAGQLKTSW